VVIDSLLQAVIMTQTKHSTVGGNPNSNPNEKNYTGCPSSPFKLEEKNLSGFSKLFLKNIYFLISKSQ
jgi:hypothetical protein